MTKKGFTPHHFPKSKVVLGKSTNKSGAGFTLIELLIVIGILAILMGAIVVAINPARQFAQARNAQRWAHVNSILTAVYQNAVDNQGTFICAAGTLPASTTTMKATAGYDICSCLVETYMATMPFDLSTGSYTSCASYDTGYQISQNATTKRITVSASSAELGETISITR